MHCTLYKSKTQAYYSLFEWHTIVIIIIIIIITMFINIKYSQKQAKQFAFAISQVFFGISWGACEGGHNHASCS